MKREGGCLCGAVRYAVEGEIEPIQLCHCGQCRKANGSAFGANVTVTADAFRLLQGADALRDYSSSPGKRRVFCGTCGSPIFSQRDSATHLFRLRVGTLDDRAGLQVGLHIYTASKAPWWTIDDGLPQHPDAVSARNTSAV